MQSKIVKVIGVSLIQAFIAVLVVWWWAASAFYISRNIDTTTSVGSPGSYTTIPSLNELVLVLTSALLIVTILGYPTYLVARKRWVEAIGLLVLTLVWLSIMMRIVS
ncbi:MAG: hypothetical protein V1719_01155 [Patescibacteria group bacterium]